MLGSILGVLVFLVELRMNLENFGWFFGKMIIWNEGRELLLLGFYLR